MAGGKTTSLLREVNLEAGKPLVDQAIKRLTFELSHSRALGCTVLKIIHGYGSSGTGDASGRKAGNICPDYGNRERSRTLSAGKTFPSSRSPPAGPFFDAENSGKTMT